MYKYRNVILMFLGCMALMLYLRNGGPTSYLVCGLIMTSVSAYNFLKPTLVGSSRKHAGGSSRVDKL